MKRKVLFAFVSSMLLFAFVFVLTSCNKTTEPTENSGTIDVTITNPDDPGTDDNGFYRITFKDYDGKVLQTSKVMKGETPAYNKSNPSRENDDNYSYTFSGWQPTLTKVSEDAIYTATYTSQQLPYNVTINLDGGTSSATKLQFRTDKISKDMLPFDVKKSGYVFKGYSLNDVKVYDENGNAVSNYQPSANMTFKAIYEASLTLTVIYTLYNPKTGQLIETFNEKPTDIAKVSETRSYKHNTYVDLFAYAKDGYTFVGWYSDDQILSNNKDYKYMMWDEDFTIEARFKYTLYDLTVWSNNNDLGQVMIRNGNSQVFYNEETLQEHYTEAVTIVAYSKTDTRFLGWYDEKNELVSTNAVYTFDMLNRDYTLEAKWNSFDITYDLDGGVNNSNNPTNYNVDTQNITLLAPTKDGFTFQGWEYNGNIITEINTANICHMKLKALWTYYTRSGNKIYLGTYPQTKVTATTENGLSSITFDSSTWTSYRYYISSSQSDFMYYKDVDIDNNGTYDYRGVYFTQYRPYYYSSSSSTDNTYQDDDGYSTNTIYWFSYDPIEWDILTESSGKALIIANLVLDSQDYYPSSSSEEFSHNGGTGYANNYELSAIRKFLNDNFYNTAFNELQKAFIETTTVDNSAATTANSSNSYACNNTNDKMFLLSYKEATTYYTSSAARQAKGSDYAKCQGLYVYSSNGKNSWWVRSPDYSSACLVDYVYSDGIIYCRNGYNASNGVRPACWINL